MVGDVVPCPKCDRLYDKRSYCRPCAGELKWWEKPSMSQYDKFTESFIEHATKATGISREELLKGWSVNAMKKYNPDETCCKCGSGEIEDEYDEGSIPRQTGFVHIPGRPEHIDRTCKNCGYLWEEAPLDSFDPEKAREAQKVREKAGHAPRKLKSEVSIKEVKGRYVTVFDNRGIQVDSLDFDEDTILNITVTKKEV